jgi:hypothetical protein
MRIAPTIAYPVAADRRAAVSLGKENENPGAVYRHLHQIMVAARGGQ